jgi:hypothetical protein
MAYDRSTRRPCEGHGRLSLCLAASLILLFSLAARADAAAPTYRDASGDGAYLFFESDEQLVAGDTDNKRDLYVRSFDESVAEDGAHVTRQLSVGPIGGNDSYPAVFANATVDGKRAFFTTEEALVGTDKDRRIDVYVRELGGNTKLVSGGATACQSLCGNGNFDVGFSRATGTGTRVLFVTAERLDPVVDTDQAVDVYLRDLTDSETYLVSAGEPGCGSPCGNTETGATSAGLLPAGGKAFFATTESLSGADADAALDVYARTLPDGPTSLISVGDPACAPCGSGSAASIFVASSSDGSRVTFVTTEGLVPGDLDGANDLYQRHEEVTRLLSSGSEAKPATFEAASEDGTRVFFTTAESLVGSGDANGATDVYMWEGSSPQLITSGACCGSDFAAATRDGEDVLFTTLQKRAVGDTDASPDLYSHPVAGGAPILVSVGQAGCSPCGNGAAPVRFNAASTDAGRVFFTTKEALSLQDFDEDDDIYVRDLAAEATTLSTPPPGLCPLARCHATFVDASSDGRHVVFLTEERLVAEDVDSEPDIYERVSDLESGTEGTRLVSTGNSPDLDLGPDPPLLQATSPASPGATLEPRILGEAEVESLIKVYPNSGCFGEPVATGAAEELTAPGILVTVAPGTTRTFWATAEADGFTSLCSNPLSYAQQDPIVAPPPSGGDGGVSDDGPSSEGPPPPSDPQTAPGTGPGTGSISGGDPAGRHDGIAYVKPLSLITFGPAARTRSLRPVFRFTDATGQPGTRFQCRLDRRRWESCGSPFQLRRLQGGRHVFRVKAVNAVGVWEERPASRIFKVVPR